MSGFIFCFNHFFKLGQKNVQNFVGFLEDGRTWYFAFEIYWPLIPYLLFFRGQRLAEQMQTQNPDLVEQLRRQMGPGPGDNNDPPPPSSN